MDLTAKLGSQTLYGPMTIPSNSGVFHYVSLGPFTYDSAWGNTLTFHFTNPQGDSTLLLDNVQLLSPQSYTVAYQADPAAGGTVSGPVNIAQHGSPGDSIAVTATPNPGFSLSSVTASNGNVVHASGYEYTLSGVTANTTVTAFFTENGGEGEGEGEPNVLSITRQDASPTQSASVRFTVAFSEAVTGVDTADFTLTATAPGAVITGVSADTGATRTVTVGTGSGEGTIRLDVVDDDSIRDVASVPLGGSGTGNGAFSAGEIYTVDRAGPSFTAFTATPPWGRPGLPVTIGFASSEMLSGNPTVTVDGNSAVYQGNDGNNYVYLYSVLGTEPDGEATIAVTGSDPVGNSGGTENTAVLDMDNRPPAGTVLINNNRSVTNSVNAALSLAWDDGAGSGAVRMRFSNDGATWSLWEPLAAVRAHTLPGGDGHKTVRVQYLDRVNNRSAACSDYIRLDTAPPTGTVTINDGAPTAKTQSVMLGLTWADAGAGVSRMRFSDDGAHWTVWETLKAARPHMLPVGLGYHTVRVQFLDAGNNYSPVYNDYIKVLAP